ncbi:hypothetical protein [Halostagnicola kamekurae]|uniref:Uncharacterized protein n=1 Tax=Halostagnicola kamekurae TaxID=619731 RepID=A0A1I6V175_9EURY|nr:hypothetical protein [Halostagnicola kamekurae]SFT07346.1 hypothetical protein SAMN04488556_4231 [Halostagnicola kamekurae]
MEDQDHTDPRRRNVLRLIGAGTIAGLSTGAVGTVAANDEDEETYSPFTREQRREMRSALQQKANESFRESSEGVSTQATIPSWIPGLPSAIPFNWCLKNIPLAPEFCALANSPVATGSFDCNGAQYNGISVSAGLAYGPSVSIDGDDFTGDIQHEVSMELLYDPDNDCFALKFSSGGVEGCTGQTCISSLPSPTESITNLMNELYDMSYDFAEEMYDRLGYTPPSTVLIVTAVVIAAIFAFSVASPVP